MLTTTVLTSTGQSMAALLLALGALAVGCSSAADGEPAAVDDTTATTASVPTAGEPADLDTALDEILAETDVVAIGAAIFDSDGLIDKATAGHRARGGDEEVTDDDLFHLGSNTKAMTAALVARLDERGDTVGFDTRLGEVFGASVDDAYATVSIAQLLSHTGGAPGDDDLDIDDQILALPVTDARATGSAELLAEPPAVEPGTAVVYSNAGYVVVAAALEHATGESWEQLMADEVFEPLGMTSCGFGAPGTPDAVDQPLGHRIEGGEAEYFDNPPLLAPAGGVHCSIDDWGNFLVELLDGLHGDSDYLDQSSVERLTEPADAPVDGLPDVGSALGWLVADGPQGPAMFHNGSNTAWFSQAVIVPSIDRVVVAVTNDAVHGEEAGQAAFRALDDLYQR